MFPSIGTKVIFSVLELNAFGNEDESDETASDRT